jgi:hypothetical protein
VQSPGIGFLFIFLFVPTLVWFLVWWRFTLPGEVELDLANKIYAKAFIPGAIVVLLAELLLALIFGALCFQDQFSEWKAAIQKSQNGAPLAISVRKTVGYFVFLFIMAYMIAALVEEVSLMHSR